MRISPRPDKRHGLRSLITRSTGTAVAGIPDNVEKSTDARLTMTANAEGVAAGR